MLRAQAESILNGYSLKALLDVVVVVGVVAVSSTTMVKPIGFTFVCSRWQQLHDDVLRAVHDDLGGLGGFTRW